MTYTVKFKSGDEAQINANHLDINTTARLYTFSLNNRSVFVTQVQEVHYISKNESAKPAATQDYKDGDIAIIKTSFGTSFVGVYKAADSCFYSSDKEGGSRIYSIDSTSVNAKITVISNIKETL